MWPFSRKAEAAPKAKLTTHQLWEEINGAQRFAGQPVDAETAMRSSAVYSCVRLITSAIACAPLVVYKRKGAQRERADTHPLAQLLRLSPNRHMTAATFWSALVADKLLHGNAYAQILRNPGGQAFALFHLPAASVQVHHTWELGHVENLPASEINRLWYRVTYGDGNAVLLDQDDVLHVPNVGWTGRGGLSTIKAMGQAVGLALSAEKSSAAFFENGMQSQIAISIPGTPSEEATARLIEHLKSRHTGAGNHHKPLILTNDGKANVLSMTAEDAQLLESRKFSVIDICRFFGVHPVMIGENEKTSSFGGGIEQMGRWFNTLTLNAHFTAIEQELERKLFTGDHFAEFDESDLTRGDTAARAAYFQAALGSMQQPGWLSQNEVRAAEGHAPVKGGEKIQTPTGA